MSSRRRGFTLVELLAVIVIIGLLASVVVVNVHNHLRRSKVRLTEASLKKLKEQITIFYLDHNRYPAEIGEMVDAYIEEVPLDGWKREFIYHVPGVSGRRFDVGSYGEDGQPGGEEFAADLWESAPK